MNATGGLLGRWLIGFCGMVILFSGTGCSVLIASAGRANLPDLPPGATRQEVRAVWGDPDASEIRGDGSRLENYHVRRKAETLYPISSGGDLGFTLLTLPLIELFATGKAIVDRAKAGTYDRVFTYGPDDRLLRSDSYWPNSLPAQRFAAARRPLDDVLWKQLDDGQCPAWSACLTSYIGDLRSEATSVGYALSPEEEQNFQRLLQIATDVDAGKIAREAGFNRLRSCAGATDLLSCDPRTP